MPLGGPSSTLSFLPHYFGIIGIFFSFDRPTDWLLLFEGKRKKIVVIIMGVVLPRKVRCVLEINNLKFIVNRIQAMVPLTAPLFGVIFLRGISSSKIGPIAPS
jgi:hypothetical protein